MLSTRHLNSLSASCRSSTVEASEMDTALGKSKSVGSQARNGRAALRPCQHVVEPVEREPDGTDTHSSAIAKTVVRLTPATSVRPC